MRLVFTKLETPLNYIEVDIGTGTFEEFSLEDLQDSETGKYIQLPDTIPANSIRVKANSSELGSFDMIKEYQITDDEGNILGGSTELEELPCYLEAYNYAGGSSKYRLVALGDLTKGFLEANNIGYENSNKEIKLLYSLKEEYHSMGEIEEVINKQLFLVTSLYTSTRATPLPYKIVIAG